MTQVVLEKVEFGYRAHDLCFLNTSVQFTPGAINVVIGQSGSGKSSLVRLILGLVKPRKGLVKIDDVNISTFNSTTLARHRSITGVAYQSPVLIEDCTPFTNVALRCRLLGIPSSDIKKRADSTFRSLELSQVKDIPCFRLSSSEKRRVSIARAVIHQPKLIVVDEPTTGLDSTLAEQIFQCFESAQESGATVIVVTADDRHVQEYSNLYSIVAKDIVPAVPNYEDHVEAPGA